MTDHDRLDKAVGDRVLAGFLASVADLTKYGPLVVQATVEEARALIRYGNLDDGASKLDNLLEQMSEDDAAANAAPRGVMFSVWGQGLDAWSDPDVATAYFDRAVSEFRTAFGSEIVVPEDWPARWRADLGLALAGIGEHDQAREILSAARCAVNATPEAARRLVMYALADNDLERASELVFEALAVLPADGETWFLAGEILARRSDRDAWAVFRNAARLWIVRDAFSHAVRALDRLIMQTPQDSDVLIALAWANAEAGDLARAEEAVEHAIAIAPGAVEPLLVRSIVRRRLELADTSLVDARTAAEIAPDDPVTLGVLSRALFAQGFLTESIGQAQRAIELSEEFEPARVWLVRGLVASGRAQEARAPIEDAFRRNPTNIELASAYAEVDNALGEFQGVVDALLQFAGADVLSPRASAMLVDALSRTDQVEEAVEIARYEYDEQHPDAELGRAMGSALARHAMFTEPNDLQSVLDESRTLAPNDSNVLVLEASMRIQANQLDQAESLLRAALEQEPMHVLALPMLVDILLNKGDDDALGEAERVARRALKVTPGDPNFRFSLARTLDATDRPKEALLLLDSDLDLADQSLVRWLDLRARLASRTGDWQKALADRREIVQRAPDDTVALLDLAEVAFEAGEWDQAMAASRQILHIDPDNAPAHGVLGAALAQVGEIGEAVRELDSALTLEPAYGFGLLQRARVARERDEVLYFLGRLQELPEATALAHTERGAAFLELGDITSAAKEYEAALAVEPDDVYSLMNLAMCHGLEGRYPVALDLAKTAVSREPDNVDALVTLGDIQRKSGSPEDAVLTLERARAVAPQSESVVDSLAETLIAIGQVDQALKIARALTVDLPESAMAWRALGNQILALGYFTESIVALRRSLELDDSNYWTHQQLGWALAHADPPDPQAAFTEYEHARLSRPDDPWAIKDLANMRHILGQENSVELYQRAIHLAEQQIKGAPNTSSLLGWCHFRLGKLNKAGRFLFTATSASTDPEPTRFDLALVTLCGGHGDEALRHFEIAAAQVARRHSLRRRAPLRVAELDLIQACRDWPNIVADSATKVMLERLRAEIEALPELPD
jgi:tetratricopeptide (TPR) repeat protein